jgi:hypothetical protein
MGRTHCRRTALFEPRQAQGLGGACSAHSARRVCGSSAHIKAKAAEFQGNPALLPKATKRPGRGPVIFVRLSNLCYVWQHAGRA